MIPSSFKLFTTCTTHPLLILKCSVLLVMYSTYVRITPFAAILMTSTAIPKCSLATTGDTLCYWAMPMHYIIGKGRKLELKSNRNYLTNYVYEVKITPVHQLFVVLRVLANYSQRRLR